MVLLLLLMSGGAWVWFQPSPAPQQVDVIQANSGEINSIIRATGVVRSEGTRHVTVAQEGMVTFLGPKTGDQVRADQLLLKLDDTDARAELDEQVLKVQEAENALKYARDNLLARQRERKLGGESANAVREAENRLRDARLTWKLASHRLETMRMKLGRYELRAPIDGVVLDRPVAKGAYVRPGDKAFVIANLESREILVKAEADDGEKLAPDMLASVSPEDRSRGPYQEKILRVEPSVRREENARYLPVWISAGKELATLKINQQVDVNIETKGRNVDVRLPLEAVLSEAGRDHVWKIQDERLRLSPVTLGLVGDRYVEISSGLKAGEAVVIPGGQVLQEGEVVSAKPIGDEQR